MTKRMVKCVNTLGKSKRGIKCLDRVKFLNRKSQLFEWENVELGGILPKIEEPIYPHIPAEIP